MFPKAWRKQLTFAFERKEQRGASLRPRHVFGQRLSRAASIDQSWAIISSPSSCISRIFLCAPQILGVVPITNRRLFVYCVQIVFEQRLPRAASIVHFSFRAYFYARCILGCPVLAPSVASYFVYSPACHADIHRLSSSIASEWDSDNGSPEPLSIG